MLDFFGGGLTVSLVQQQSKKKIEHRRAESVRRYFMIKLSGASNVALFLRSSSNSRSSRSRWRSKSVQFWNTFKTLKKTTCWLHPVCFSFHKLQRRWFDGTGRGIIERGTVPPSPLPPLKIVFFLSYDRLDIPAVRCGLEGGREGSRRDSPLSKMPLPPLKTATYHCFVLHTVLGIFHA